MSEKNRKIVMGMMIAATCAWALITIVMFVFNQVVSDMWLLATILVYAILFVAAILLLFLATPVEAGDASTRMSLPAPSGPAHETVFATRRGTVEIERPAGRNVAHVVLSEPGRPIDVGQLEVALDGLQAAEDEAATSPPSSGVPVPGARIPKSRSAATTGREAIA